MKSVVPSLALAFTAFTLPLFAQNVPPTIVNQPYFEDGTNVTLTVETNVIPDDYILIFVDLNTDVTDTTSCPLTYQWFKGTTKIGTDSFYYKDTTITSDAGNYSVKISNCAGSVTSSIATLIAVIPPAITQPPQDTSVIAGGNAIFAVKATGTTPLYYQWYSFYDGLIPGATNSILTLRNVQASADQDQYSATVSNAAGPNYVVGGFTDPTAPSATLTVLAPPIIDTQPYFDDGTTNTTNIVGDDVLISIDINEDTTDTGTCPLTYQWRQNGTIISGETDSTLQLNNVDASDAGNYTVKISNCAGSIISAAASLTVLVPPTITLNPVDRTVKAGSNATFTVKATGTPPLYYQWYFGSDPIPSATNSSVNFSNSTLSFLVTDTDQAGVYWVEVTNLVDVDDSDLAQLTVVAETVKPTLSITSPKEGTRWTNTAVITVRGTASDNARVEDVQFQYNGSSFSDATGTTNWVASFPAAAGTNVFRVQAIDTSANKSAFATRNIFYPVPSPFTLVTNGQGSVTPKPTNYLEIGRGYTLTAKAGAGQVFAGWAKGVTSTNPVLNFLMQPNLELWVNFIPNPFAPVKGTYNCLFYQTNGITHDTSGFLTFALTSAGLYSGKVLIGGGTYSFKGGLWVDGTSTTQIPRSGKPALTLTLLVDLTNGTDRATGTVTASGLKALLSGDRLVFNASSNPATQFAGNYTLAFLHQDNDASVPMGDGVGSASVNSGGIATLAGMLADGTAIKQSVGVSKNAQWPFYVNLYSGKGSALGWLTFTNLVTNSIEGDVSWIKTPVSGKYYTNGFATDIETRGSLYAAPLRGVRVLNLTNGEAVFSDGGLGAPLTNAVSLTTNNVFLAVTNNKLSLKLTTSSGLVSGSFNYPGTKLSSKINGVVLPEDNTLRGFFLSTNLSGAVILRPAP